jgi:hypothetical protein
MLDRHHPPRLCRAASTFSPPATRALALTLKLPTSLTDMWNHNNLDPHNISDFEVREIIIPFHHLTSYGSDSVFIILSLSSPRPLIMIVPP